MSKIVHHKNIEDVNFDIVVVTDREGYSAFATRGDTTIAGFNAGVTHENAEEARGAGMDPVADLVSKITNDLTSAIKHTRYQHAILDARYQKHDDYGNLDKRSEVADQIRSLDSSFFELTGLHFPA